MSNKTEKRVASKNSAATPLPDDLAALFAGTAQVSPRELPALAKAAKVLHADPAFQADLAKGLIVEDILRAMEAQGLNRNTLAAKLGKSRQYIGKILDEEQPANFTIDTLAELSAVLGISLHVRMLPKDDRMIFVRGITVTTKVESTVGFPKSPTKHAVLLDERFEVSHVTSLIKTANDKRSPAHDRTRYSA